MDRHVSLQVWESEGRFPVAPIESSEQRKKGGILGDGKELAVA
jgi:hypothetical protein